MITATTSHTIRFTRKGDPGAPGSRGAVLRGPQLWDSLPNNYAFQAGKEGEQWQDVVIYNDQYYVCTLSHSKNPSVFPGCTLDIKLGLWQLGDKVELVASKILLSEYAVIDNLGASAIEMKDASGDVVFEAKNGDVICRKGTFDNVNVHSGKVAGFEISGDEETGTYLTNTGFSNDSCIIIRNDDESVFSSIGGNVLPAATGVRAVARFENHGNDGLTTNYGILVSAKNAAKNVAIQIGGGCVSGFAYQNQIINGTATVNLARGVNSIIAVGTGNVPIYLPKLQACDDGYVMRVQSLKDSGAMRIYASECTTAYGTAKPLIVCYVDGRFTAVTPNNYFDLTAPGYALEFIYFRDLGYTVSGTTYRGVWLQYKMPRDW